MNEYLKVFQAITQFSDRLLADEYQSVEIKQSATHLSLDVEPCIQEIKQSALRLKALAHVCFKDVSQAEDVWNSKPRIAKASAVDVWEQIGELSGCDVRIRSLGKKGKYDAVVKVRKSWSDKATKLKNKWFLWDQNQQVFKKDSIGFYDKDNLYKELRNEVDYQGERVILIVENELNSIFKELQSIDIEKVEYCIECFDFKSQSKFRERLQSIGGEIVSKFTEPLRYLPESYMKTFKETLRDPVETLVHKSKMGISLSDFEESCKVISSILDDLILAVFEERMKLGIQTVEKAIMFYNNFLEKQARYQLETAQQRAAEKNWIEYQRQQLREVEQYIESVISH
ncbi:MULTISPECIES: hypothetical protein [unclassified Microcoleus]|uniref:hypothetical protein n=1 Tax=unclassified Microcoleus TaxID=2642155 RepID=UPI0026003D80|nr:MULTISPECIES: hypothetical protein [unclassified Microcoleus]